MYPSWESWETGRGDQFGDLEEEFPLTDWLSSLFLRTLSSRSWNWLPLCWNMSLLSHHIWWMFLGLYYFILSAPFHPIDQPLPPEIFCSWFYCDFSFSVFPSHLWNADVSLVFNLHSFFPSFLYSPLNKTMSSATVSMLLISSPLSPKRWSCVSIFLLASSPPSCCAQVRLPSVHDTVLFSDKKIENLSHP